MALEYFNVFETFEDISTEYKLKKVKYNAENFVKLCDQLSPTVTKLTCVGFIGDLDSIVNACAQFLKLTTEQTHQLLIELKGNTSLPESSNEHSKEKESMILINNESQIAFLYCHSTQIFNTGPLSPTILAVDYVRYMLDVCEKIIIMPPGDTICDDTMVNPFQDTANTAVHVQERNVRPDETISISQLADARAFTLTNLANNARDMTSSLCSSVMRLSQDHTRFLYTLYIHAGMDVTNKKVYASSRDLETAFLGIQIQKWIDYEEAIRAVRQSWHKPKCFVNLKERALKIFLEFVPIEKCSSFHQLLDSIKNEYQSILNAKTNDADLHFVTSTIIKYFEQSSCIERVNRGGLVNAIMSKIENCSTTSDESTIADYTKVTNICSGYCRTIADIFSSIINTSSHPELYKELLNILKQNFPNSLNIMVHEDRSYQYETMKKLWRDHVRNRPKKLDDELIDARQGAIMELIKWLEEHNQHTVCTPQFDLHFTFYEINPIRDSEANVIDYKVSQKAFELRMRETGSIEHIYLSQIFFVSEKIGYFNIANFPANRSSLFYFSCLYDNKIPVQLVQISSSPVSKLIIDEKSNIYFIYDNITQRAERGKLDEYTRLLQAPVPVNNLFGNIIEDLVGEDGLPKRLSQIETASFLYGSDSILILDGQFNLIEYRYMQGSMKLVCCRINRDTYIEKIQIRPNDDKTSRYLCIDVIPTGKCVLLQCEASIDIYDLTWAKIGSIPIIQPATFLGFKSFSDQTNTFVALVNEPNTITIFLLRGLSATRTLEIKQTTFKRNKGFPLLDIFYLSQRKFGPSSDSIGCPRKTHITFILPDKFPVSADTLETYFNQLYIIGINLEILPAVDEDEWKIIFRRLPQIQLKDFKRIIESRVPIHIVTIEASNIFPLCDGRNITNELAAWKNSNENKIGLIQYITELTRIGSYESCLSTFNQPLKVIAIVGRQSGGKSYFLNRVTGARFNVASTRCTDGIWLSTAFLHSQFIVVLDCEGLFSTRRNDLEEIKLVLALTAVADILLLNQDLSFNRYITQLFSSFAKSCDRIKGSQLFKGFLMMLIRDVSSQDADGAYKELIGNIRQQAENSRSTYLEKLFGGKIVGHCIHHFENRIFDVEIEQVRKMIANLPFRWNSGAEFLESLKLTLAQVHTDDDTVMDVHRLKMAFTRLDREAHIMLMHGGKQFSTCDQVIIKIQQLIDPNIEDEISIDQQQLSFVNNDVSSDSLSFNFDYTDKENLFNSIIDLFVKHCQNEYQETYHNTWFTNISRIQIAVLEHRIAFIISYVHSQLTTDPIYAADIRDFETTLKSRLTQFIQLVRLCLRSCHECQRLCTANFDHRDDCNCETDHICKEICEVCSNSNLCCQLYGHEGKHRCNNGHTCGKPCTVTPMCTLFCSLETDHDTQDEHDCKNRHHCLQKCSQYPECDKNCAFDVRTDHNEHDCGGTTCPFTCQMPDCRQRCIFPSHIHQRLIIENKINELKYGELTLDYHICGAEHTCNNACVQEGVCFVGYEIIEKEWRNPMNTFPYKFYEPKLVRSKCILTIPLYTLTHENQAHNCKVEHRCDIKCPECRSFCQLPYGHTTPYHETKNHRNKECNVFVSSYSKTKAIIVKNDGKAREYEPGESCKPEICSESCERRGRSHFHLRPCPGGEECAGKLYRYAKHSPHSWYPYEDRKYDLWLCEHYWHSLGWKPPYNDNVLTMIGSCSFCCGRSSHDDNTPSFCIKPAWHSDEHVFTCKHDPFDRLDIVFCCDATASMGSYITESKKTVRRIIEAAKTVKDVKFRFVAYRDHPPQDTTFVTESNSNALSDATSVIAYIEKLHAIGGGDGPEAVLDGLYDAVTKTRWRDGNTLKYIVHIADAPPHGSIYTGRTENFFIRLLGCSDHWPGGCPCGLTIERISDAINSQHIRYKLMKIGTYPNAMSFVFKRHIKDFEETDLSGALDLSEKFVGILIRDLQTEEIDVNV